MITDANDNYTTILILTNPQAIATACMHFKPVDL